MHLHLNWAVSVAAETVTCRRDCRIETRLRAPLDILDTNFEYPILSDTIQASGTFTCNSEHRNSDSTS